MAITPAVPQPAQTIQIFLTADQATALEQWRLLDLTRADRTAPFVPRFSSIAAMLDGHFRVPGGLLAGAFARCPSASLVAARLAAAAAQAMAATATAAPAPATAGPTPATAAAPLAPGSASV